jgi:hypothetical protein
MKEKSAARQVKEPAFVSNPVPAKVDLAESPTIGIPRSRTFEEPLTVYSTNIYACLIWQRSSTTSPWSEL